MGRRSKLILATMAVALMTTLGMASPADARPAEPLRAGDGGGWCC